MNLFTPIRSIISRLAPVDNWHFIGSAALTVVFDRMDIHGDWKERLSTTGISTSVVTAQTILGGKINDTAWIRIVSVSGGTLYGLPAKNAFPGQVLSASNGWTIAAGDRIGLAPNTGTFIASIQALQLAQLVPLEPGTRTVDEIDGLTATLVPATPQAGRRVYSVTNLSSTMTLWLRYVANGAAIPTISSTNHDRAVLPGKTVDLALSDGWDVYMLNSTGAATLVDVVVQEMI